MTDHHDVKLRELTFKLMHMAPDAPPFPETPMTTLTPQRAPEKPTTPPRRRTWSGPAVAAGAFALVLLIALPAVLLRGDEVDPTPPATNPPATTEAPPTTQVPATTTPPTTQAPTSTPPPTTLAPAPITELWADLPGGALLDGATVIETPLVFTGRAQGASEVSVNGAIVPVVDDFFEASVDLTPGLNEISIGEGATATLFEVTYIPAGTVEFAFLTNVSGDEIVADYAQWLTGDEADQAAIEDGEIPEGDTVPNGYYIRNQNPQLRTLPLASDAAVMLPTSALGSVEVTPVAAADWLALFKPDGTPWNPAAGDEAPASNYSEPHFGYFGAGDVEFGYWLTLDGEGTVVQVVGQYRP
jgi:hypothetical protein